MTQYEATQKVLRIKENTTDEEMAKVLGISRPTLYARLKFHSWKVSEITHIKNL